MPRLPGPEALGGVSFSTRAGIPSGDAGIGAITGAAQRLGGVLTQIGEESLKQDAVLEGAAVSGMAQKELSDFERSFDQDSDYATFQARFEKGANAIRDKYAGRITSPRARETWALDFNQSTLGSRNRVLDLSQSRTRESKLVDAKSGLEGYQSIIADPDAAEDVRAKARKEAEASIAALNRNGLLSPADAADWNEKIIKGGEFVLGQRQIERDPNVISGGVPSDIRKVIVDAASRYGIDPNALVAIAAIESGGNPNAKNPNSSAGGLFQFVDGTAKDYGLANRYDAAQAADAAARLARDNAAHLRTTLGRDPTAGELYLAHQQGAGGAASLLKNPNALATDIVGYDAVRLNGGAPGMTAGQFAAKWINKVGAGSGTVPSWYDNASPSDQLKFEAMSNARQGEIDRQIAAQTAADRAAAVDDYRLRIASGDATLSKQDIMDSPVIDNGDKATLITSYDDKWKETIQTTQDMQAFATTGLRVDPFEDKDRKRVDAVYQEGLKVGGPEAAQPVAEEIVRQTGIVPKPAMSMMRRGIESVDAEEVMQALQAAQRIATINPAALSRREGGAAIQSASDDFGYYVNTLNMDPTDAAQRLIEARDPAKQRDRKALEPAAKMFIKEVEGESLSAMFDDAWFSDPSVGFTPGSEYGMKAEFQAIAEEKFFSNNGNAELALNAAKEEMKRLYGVTRLTGRPVVMKHPPERYWPQYAVSDSAQSLSYPAQLQNDVRSLNPDADMASISLVTTPATDAMVKRGEPPAYAVLYTDKNGVMQAIPGQLWRPDFTKLRDMQGSVDDAAKAKQMDGARRKQVQQRQIAPYQTQTPNDFLSGSDPVFGERPDAPPAPPAPASPTMPPAGSEPDIMAVP